MTTERARERPLIGILTCPRATAPRNQCLLAAEFAFWSGGLTMPADLPAGHLLPYSARPRRPDLASSGRTGRYFEFCRRLAPALDGCGEVPVRSEEVIEPVRIIGVLPAGHHRWDRLRSVQAPQD